jgi:23S rRNA (guanine1835-N2)-methyltransferase
VLLKVPKSLSLLEDQLHRLRPALRDGASIVGAAMAKHIHTSTLALFEKILGPTRTSLAEKKARLIHCTFDATRAPPRNPWPRTYVVPTSGEVITGHAGVFSPDHYDVGARFFLDQLLAHFARTPLTGRVVDLGCGNGVVGTLTALRNPAAELTFVDESYRAVASAEATFRANLPAERVAHFVVGNKLFEPAMGTPIARGSVDAVLNNPPFHAEQSVGDETAREMFSEAHAALRTGGSLWVVGNLHLDYEARIRRIFGAVETVATNDKFAVLRATRR